MTGRHGAVQTSTPAVTVAASGRLGRWVQKARRVAPSIPSRLARQADRRLMGSSALAEWQHARLWEAGPAAYLTYLALASAIRRAGSEDRRARTLFYLLARFMTPSVKADAGPNGYYVRSGEYVGYSLYTRGSFEADHLATTTRLLDDLGQYRRGGHFVDIGANVGSSCVTAVSRFEFERAVAIEPLPANYELLRQNILVNGLQDRITSINAALSDQRGSGSLEINPVNLGDSRIRVQAGPHTQPVADLQRESERPVQTVELTTFDTLADEGVVDVASLGLVWIDTQGHEGQVLAGARSLLATSAPILMEFWPYGLQRADGLERLEQIIRDSCTHVVDVRAAGDGDALLIPSSRIGELTERYAPKQGNEYTDLLLLTL